MIATFPIFTNLEIQHLLEIQKFTSRFEPYSDFNFASMLCWDTDKSTKVSWLNGNLVLSLPDYLTGETNYSLLGENQIDKSIGQLLKIAPKLNLVPEIVVSKIANKSSFQITEDRDSFDYIYNLADLAILTGNAYKKKRNKLNRIQKDIGSNLRAKIVIDFTPQVIQEIKNVAQEWNKISEKKGESTENENIAIENMLKQASNLNLMMLEFFYDDRLVGFSVNEVIDTTWAICHFEKASNIHEDIYTYIAHQVAQELLSVHARYVNWEQDLGLPGLRKSKMNYQPAGFLKKYQVRLISVT